MADPPKVPKEVQDAFSGAHFAGLNDMESLEKAIQRYNELLLGEGAINAGSDAACCIPDAFQAGLQATIDSVMP